jgi:DNA mismatch repair protein MutL
MPDIIRLLPDSVANQIAAGEVIQRPASVVKELLENAIDAGATSVSVNIKDAGRTVIQVTDNGCGMSETDARMAFERHSTSKIISAEDLFAIQTLGFRGEALASIAAVSEVVLKSKRVEDEVGTRIEVNASEVISQEPVACMDGSNFLVRNLFFNVPARRKFLKADTTELKHIITEFYRVVLTRPEIEFILIHNDTEIYSLPPSNLKQRIIKVFGNAINQVLIPLQSETSIIMIQGFIGTPESARKTYGEQFFFINRRYMRHPYFHKAVSEAYEQVLPPDSFPSYFIYMESSPESIDINIHPTKTEIKFEDEKAIFHILLASVREALGRNNLVPSIDFDRDTSIEIPIFRKDEAVSIPEIDINPDYNPFDKQWSGDQQRNGKIPAMERLSNWELLYKGTSNDGAERFDARAGSEPPEGPNLYKFVQLRNRYIVTPVKSGLLVIDQKRAHERILYEKYMTTLSNGAVASQQDLYPATIRLNAADHTLLMEIFDDICSLGFDIRDLGNQSIAINGLPADIRDKDPAELIDEFLEYYKQTESDIKSKAREKLAMSMAKASSIPYHRALDNKEMRDLTDQLFASKEPAVTPDGKQIYIIWQTEDLEKRFS